MRARVIAYAKARVKADEVPTYESRAEPKWKGRLCVRSSSNVYNLSLMGALIEQLGEAQAEAWAKAVRANMAIYPIDARGLQAVIPGGDARQASGRGVSLFSGRGAAFARHRRSR